MKKICKILSILMAVILLAATFAASTYADLPDSSKKASLTVTYKNGDTAFEGLEIKIYRIASLNEHGEYSLAGDFKGYPVKVYGVGSKEEWRVIASTLSAFVSADGISPSASAVTDTDGKAHFADLPHGMYLVAAVRCETEDAYYSFEQFIAVVPRPTEDGGYNYDVEAVPKFTSSEKEDGEREFKLVKLWRGEGNEDVRPEKIKLELFRNGEHYEEVTLSADNNWSYTWKAPTDNSSWEVVERDVPDGFTVSVIREGEYIAVTNTYEDGEDKAPQTGDDVSLLIPAAIFSLAGVVVLIVAMKMRKRED